MKEEYEILNALETSYIEKYGKDNTYSLVKEILKSSCVQPQFKHKIINHLIKKKSINKTN